MRQLNRYRDADPPIPLNEVAKMRAFFDAWASDLTKGGLARGAEPLDPGSDAFGSSILRPGLVESGRIPRI